MYTISSKGACIYAHRDMHMRQTYNSCQCIWQIDANEANEDTWWFPKSWALELKVLAPQPPWAGFEIRQGALEFVQTWIKSRDHQNYGYFSPSVHWRHEISRKRHKKMVACCGSPKHLGRLLEPQVLKPGTHVLHGEGMPKAPTKNHTLWMWFFPVGLLLTDRLVPILCHVEVDSKDRGDLHLHVQVHSGGFPKCCPKGLCNIESTCCIHWWFLTATFPRILEGRFSGWVGWQEREGQSKGCLLWLRQVESGSFPLSPWLLFENQLVAQQELIAALQKRLKGDEAQAELLESCWPWVQNRKNPRGTAVVHFSSHRLCTVFDLFASALAFLTFARPSHVCSC